MVDLISSVQTSLKSNAQESKLNNAPEWMLYETENNFTF